MMKIYQFVKYNENTSLSHFKNYENDKIVVCFDFEDGIQNLYDNTKTSELKKKHRNYFISIAQKLKDTDINIGLRINSKDTLEFEKDIAVINGMKIYSVIIPKIETPDNLLNIISELKKNGIIYKEIIPIIETKKGFDNIEEIIEQSNINNIAFGHCDYNLDLNIFPFFHQDSHEYWRWVHRIVSITNSYNVRFINSGYLSLNNQEFFLLMLDYLGQITHNNFGQFTLTSFHTNLCLNKINNSGKRFKKLLKNKLQLYPNRNLAIELINAFEKDNKGKGLTKTKDSIISYQEYISAKKNLAKQSKKVNFVFVGGCFPVQHNILYEDNFLYKMSKNISNSCSVEILIDIIRYERFFKVMDKITKLHSTKKIDVLVFHIRPEPYLRIVKLYYKFVNNNGIKKHSLNIPLFKMVNPEKYDYLILGRKYERNKKLKKSKIHDFLIDLNYFTGKMVGNKSYAVKKYIELVMELEKYCLKNKIKLILLGPNSRNNTKHEPSFCKDLDFEMQNSFQNLQYISGMDSHYNGKNLLNNNGIHVNEFYHTMIADRIESVIEKLLSPTKMIIPKID